MADGGVKIEVGLNTSKAEKDLARLKEKIAKAENTMNERGAARSNLQRKLDAASASADKAKAHIEELKTKISELEMASNPETKRIEFEDYLKTKDQIAEASKQLAEEEKTLKEQEKDIEKINVQLEKETKQYEKSAEAVKEMKDQAGEMVHEIERARPGETLARGFEQAKKSAMKFLKYAIGIRSVFFLWRRLRQYISDAVQLYAEYDKETKYNLALMQATKKAIQGTFGSAFTQIYTALLPVIQRIANWMLEAANAAARFIAILSGKGSYKKAVVDVAEVEKSIADAAEDANDEIEDTTDAAKELQRTLAPIDELNILNGDSGSGSTKQDKEKEAKLTKTDIDGIKYIEETLDKLDESMLDKLALNLKDVLFNWDDLNPEQIAKKFIAGLGAVLGGALGLALGLGPGGVLMLTLGGLLLGLLIDSLIFDNDGRLSEHEIVSMIIIALGALVGGIIGFAAGGGFKGALIGAWIGAGIGLLIQQLLVKKGASLTIDNLLKTLVPILNAMIGGAVGGMLGLYFTASPAGAAAGAVIGAVIGAGLTMIFKSITAKSGTKGKTAMDKIAKVLTLATGGLIGFMIGGGVGAVIGTILAGIVVAITSIALDSRKKGEDFKNSEFGREVAALKEDIEKGLETDADIKVHINSITGEVDESTIADLAVAQNLIDSIFTLDAKSNKTTEEAALLKQQIETLNGMNLEGIRVQFNETTGTVETTRLEVQGLLDDLLQQYRLEAMKEAYIESFKAQFDATENVKRATDDAKGAAEKYETAVSNLKTAQDEYNQALNDYNQYLGEYNSTGSGSALSEDAEAASQRLSEASKALDTAKQGIDSTKEAAESAKSYLETTLETADLATTKVGEIETALTDLVTNAPEKGEQTADGLGEGMSNHTQKAVDAAKAMASKTLTELQTVLDTGSPSKETEKIGKWTVEGFENGIRDKTPDAVNAVKEMMDQIFREFDTNLRKIKNLMNFSWKLPRPSIPQINYKMQSVRYGRGQTVSFPQFFVEWYAKGGVFDFPQLIGVGENGKEAVVPLEKNTEWMTKVADGLMERLEQANFANQLADAFMRTPMPAMAGGGIVPPGAVQGSAFSAEGMEAALERGVYNAMMAMGNQRSNKGSWQININGHEFMRAIWSDFKDVQGEHGISMIET